MTLCTLAQVKQYAGISGSASDAVLSGLISAYSAKAATYCSRIFELNTQTESLIC